MATAKDIKVITSKDTKQIILPDLMTHKEAVEWLIKDHERGEKKVAIHREFMTFPMDGAYAFARATAEIFGFSEQVPTPGFFGDKPPSMITVDIGGGKTIRVPWGRIKIPGVDGFLEVGVNSDLNGLPVLYVAGEVKNKNHAKVNLLLDRTQELINTSSIYKGRAVRITFRDVNGEELDPQDIRPDFAPQFMDPCVEKKDVIYDKLTMQEIQDYVVTPVINQEACNKAGVPPKRGILFEGPYGTGKTMAGAWIATECERNDVTFVNLNDSRDMAKAINFALRYAPAVVWAEDIEKAVGLNRTTDVDQILNTVDGIDSKNKQVMIVVTTNHLDQVNEAMRRPGRFDAIIHIGPPDAEAALRLVKLYGRGLIKASDLELIPVADALSGKIPAVIRECVERAKLSAITRVGKEEIRLTADDLLISARSLNKHLEIMAAKRKGGDPIRIGINVNGESRVGELVEAGT